MTDEELSKLIGEFLPYPSKDQHYALRSFARIVAAAEREACIEAARTVGGNAGAEVEKLIRARGDALAKLNQAAEANGEEL